VLVDHFHSVVTYHEIGFSWDNIEFMGNPLFRKVQPCTFN